MDEVLLLPADADHPLAGGPIRDFFEGQVKKLIASQVEAVIKAVQSGDLSAVEGIVSFALSQLKAHTGLTISPDELLQLLSLGVTVSKGDPADICDALGDTLKKAATHLRKKPILVAATAVTLEDADGNVLAAWEDVKDAVTPKAAAGATGDSQEAGWIIEAITIGKAVVQLIQWIRSRRQGK